MTPWYFRLFYIPVLNFVISFALFGIIKAKRMTSGGPSKPFVIVYMLMLIGFCVLMWFIPFKINLAFWIGISIIVFGQVVFALGYSAMREHLEQKKAVVDWGIYKISRHSHVLAGIITDLGAIIMGWNLESTIYPVLWVYFALDIIISHLGVLSEEKINMEKFGQEYKDYIKRVPRYFLIRGK